MELITIAIDAMGGDYGPMVVVPAAMEVLAKHQNLTLILVGDEMRLKRSIERRLKGRAEPRLIIKHASEVVENDESPSVALRKKRDSSMRVAIELVHDGEAAACVSAGNTGALMATARLVLRTMPGVSRPAIMALFPTMIPNKYVRVLDLGANVDSSAEQLVQFAIMGSIVTESVDNHVRPRVGLLNIGEEEIKGNEVVKKTHQLLSETESINYIGSVEGTDVYRGVADVVVCDGFIGNIFLKSSEGLAHLILNYVKQAFRKNLLTKFVGLLTRPILRGVAQRINPSEYNGASFLGLQGIVIKSHGGARVKAFSRAIEEAVMEVEKDVAEKIHTQVVKLLDQGESPEQAAS